MIKAFYMAFVGAALAAAPTIAALWEKIDLAGLMKW